MVSKETPEYRITVPSLRKISSASQFLFGEKIILSDERTIRGDIAFHSSVKAGEGSANTFSTGVLTIRLKKEKDEEENGNIVGRLCVTKNEGWEHVVPKAHLSLFFFADQFERLWNAIDNHKQLDVRVKGGNWNSLGHDYINQDIALIEFELFDADVQSNNLIEKNRIDDLKRALNTCHINHQHTNCQAVTICSQFAESLSHLDDKYKGGYTQDVVDFIDTMRTTLRSDLIESDNDYKLRIDDFKIKISSYDAKKSAVMTNEYDILWKRKSVTDVLKNGWCIADNDVENIAAKYLYLARQGIHSVAVEEILIDVLLLLHIVKYTRTNLGYGITLTTILQISSGPYMPRAVRETFSCPQDKIFWRRFIMAVGSLINFSINSLIIWWVAGLLTGEERMARWILFGTFTAANWILTSNSILTSLYKTPDIKAEREEIHFQHLRHLCLLHDRTADIDIGLLRHMIYKLEERGAGFDGSILKILSFLEKRATPDFL